MAKITYTRKYLKRIKVPVCIVSHSDLGLIGNTYRTIFYLTNGREVVSDAEQRIIDASRNPLISRFIKSKSDLAKFGIGTKEVEEYINKVCS